MENNSSFGKVLRSVYKVSSFNSYNQPKRADISSHFTNGKNKGQRGKKMFFTKLKYYSFTNQSHDLSLSLLSFNAVFMVFIKPCLLAEKGCGPSLAAGS